MIPQLEQWIRESWDSLAPRRQPPHQVHIAKLSVEDYPAPTSALLFFAFADHDATPIAVAKVARIATGDATVEREARLLERVREHLPQEFRDLAPRPVRAGRINERAALVMTALPGEVEMHHTWNLAMASRIAPRLTAALEWVDRLAAATTGTTRTAGDWLGDTPQALAQSVARLGGTAESVALLEARLTEFWSTAWPCGVAHGDFFPGNLLFAPGTAGATGWRGVAAVDWMLAELDAPGFFDPLFYELSFTAQVLYGGGAIDKKAVLAAHSLAPFADVRSRWRDRGIDIGLGSPARLATLVHAAVRDAHIDAGRRSIAQSWLRLLEIELCMHDAAAARAPHVS